MPLVDFHELWFAREFRDLSTKLCTLHMIDKTFHCIEQFSFECLEVIRSRHFLTQFLDCQYPSDKKRVITLVPV